MLSSSRLLYPQQFGRCRGRTGHCADIAKVSQMTRLGSGVCIAAVETTLIGADGEEQFNCLARPLGGVTFGAK